MYEILDISKLNKDQLAAYHATLMDALAQLDKREPQDMLSEEYEAWGDEHEALEDLLEDVEERLES